MEVYPPHARLYHLAPQEYPIPLHRSWPKGKKPPTGFLRCARYHSNSIRPSYCFAQKKVGEWYKCCEECRVANIKNYEKRKENKGNKESKENGGEGLRRSERNVKREGTTEYR